MSIQELLVPNDYNLFGRSITVNTLSAEFGNFTSVGTTNLNAQNFGGELNIGDGGVTSQITIGTNTNAMTPIYIGDTGSAVYIDGSLYNPLGPTGPQGVTGPKGATGATGAIGLTGATGAAGLNGVTGATGAAGTNGTNGVTGPTGPTGSSSGGVSGTTGNTFTMSFSGPFSTTQTIEYTKIGNQVTMYFPSISNTSGSSTYFTSDHSIPVDARPEADMFYIGFGVSNGADSLVTWDIGQAGDLTIGSGASLSGAFTSGGLASYFNSTFTWLTS